MKNRRGTSPRRGRQTLAAIAVLTGVAVAAVFLFARPYLRAAAPVGSAPEPDAVLRISMSGWQPAELRATGGETITIRMVNLDNRFHTDGGGWHNFVVPFTGFEERVGPEQTTTFSLKVPAAKGVYLFYCDVCCGGKDNPYMQGKLIVS